MRIFKTEKSSLLLWSMGGEAIIFPKKQGNAGCRRSMNTLRYARKNNDSFFSPFSLPCKDSLSVYNGLSTVRWDVELDC